MSRDPAGSGACAPTSPLPYGAARAAADLRAREGACWTATRDELTEPAGHDSRPRRAGAPSSCWRRTTPSRASFSLSVIARNDDAVEAAVLAAAARRARCAAGRGAHERRPSAHGKYVSHRLKVPCASAEAVLALYARLRAVDGVDHDLVSGGISARQRRERSTALR